jgi:O-antigen/teichoic acid export membrane protein
MLLVTQAFRTANAPFQFEMASDKDALQIYSRTLTYYMLITSLIAVPLSLFARPVLSLLTTEAYLGAHQVVALAVYSAIAYGLYQIISVGLLVTKKTGFTGTAIGAGALINIGYLAALVPLLGILGAALATLLTHLTVVVFLFIGSQRAYPIPYDLGRVFRIFISAGSVIAVGALISPHSFWLDSLMSTGLFVIFLIMVPVLSLIEPGEQRSVVNRLKGYALKAIHG